MELGPVQGGLGGVPEESLVPAPNGLVSPSLLVSGRWSRDRTEHSVPLLKSFDNNAMSYDPQATGCGSVSVSHCRWAAEIGSQVARMRLPRMVTARAAWDKCQKWHD